MKPCYLCRAAIEADSLGRWACRSCGAVFKVVQWNTVVVPAWKPESVEPAQEPEPAGDDIS